MHKSYWKYKQVSSDNLSILRDTIPFKPLLIPKIKELLSDFTFIINDIYDYLTKNINSIISETFGDYKNLEKRILEVYNKYSSDKNGEMFETFKRIYDMET